MKTQVGMIAAAGTVAMLFGSLAQAAAPVLYQAKINASVGYYEEEVQFRSGGLVVNQDLDGTMLGIGGSFGVAVGRTFGSVSVEYLSSDVETDDGNDDVDRDRSDVAISGGYRFAKNFSAFLGYRYATQGDGFFEDEEGFRQIGPFVGLGVGGVNLGPNWLFSSSLALSFIDTDLDVGGGDRLDFDNSVGASIKLSITPRKLPLTTSLRYQVFNTDVEEGGDRLDFDQDYYMLTVEYAFLQGRFN